MDAIDHAIQAAISNESNSYMEIDIDADQNIQAALNNVNKNIHVKAAVNFGTKKRPREMVQSMATEVQLIAGKRQSNRCGFAIKKEAKVEKNIPCPTYSISSIKKNIII
jgi:hypothetical protein